MYEPTNLLVFLILFGVVALFGILCCVIACAVLLSCLRKELAMHFVEEQQQRAAREQSRETTPA